MVEMYKIILSLACGTCLLGGCAPVEVYKTEPVQIQTTRGLVKCQLYLHHIVYLDEAISWPDGVDQSYADRQCLQFGWDLAEKKLDPNYEPSS
jgi:hypothetical protein